MSWQKSPFTSRTSAAGRRSGFVACQLKELARERVHTGGGFAGAHRAENRHAGIESTLGDDQPFWGRALDGSDGVMHFPDDDRRAVRREAKVATREGATGARD